MERKIDYLSALNHSLLGFVMLLVVGSITMNLEQIIPPYGYLLRFLAYTALTFACVRYLAKSAGFTLHECRITRIRLHPVGIAVSILLPGIVLLWTIHGEPGHFVYNAMPTEQALEIILYLLFHTGFCSGIVEEVMFRGVLTRICEEGFSKRFAWIVPTVLFVLPHLRNIENSYDFVRTFLFMSAISVLFTVLTYVTGTVWDAVLVHAFWDMFAARSFVVAVSSEVQSGSFFTYVLENKEFHPLMDVGENERQLLFSVLFLLVAGMVALVGRTQRNNR